MSGFALKLIAMITMLIDHTGAILFEGSQYYMYFRMIGRLAFPIYCFLLVEGFYHTSNVKRYLKRLGIFALISEIPFDLAFSKNITNTNFLDSQNVFFTLYIGLLVIYFISLINKKYPTDILKQNLLTIVIVIIGCFASILLATDYEILGVLLIVSFYLFRTNKLLLTIVVLLLNYELAGTLQALATVSMVFIWFYNGKKGLKLNKYIFYAFYPAHILILVLISKLI
jgi:hypothetical protein